MFGCTELFVWLPVIFVCDLSSGHGPGGQGFEGVWKGVHFYDLLFQSVDKNKNMRMHNENR